MVFHNIYSKNILEKKIQNEKLNRLVLSFYRYVSIDEPRLFRDELYQSLSKIHVLGRIYIASEGINAQLSVPENLYHSLRDTIDSFPCLKGVYLNRSIAGKKDAFLKLMIKHRKKIVNDGLGQITISTHAQVNNHISPKEANELLQSNETIAVDLRNHYESEVGHFENALRLPVKTYREGLKSLPPLLKGQEGKNILLYCTGGIRCEKVSTYLRSQNFSSVYQLKGGIVSYFREVVESQLPSKFIGKNFVFDRRLGEKISNDTISHCHQCGGLSDEHTNCANEECHILIIQCEKCRKKYKGCCSEECREIFEFPRSIQKLLRRGRPGYPTKYRSGDKSPIQLF